MKKISYLLVMTILMSLFAVVPVQAEEVDFPDYSSWTVAYSEDSLTGTKWAPTGTYEDFVLELDITVNSGDSGYGLWYNFRTVTPKAANSRFFVDTTAVKAEKTWGDYDYQTLSTGYGKLGTLGTTQKIRISAIGTQYIMEEYINDAWQRVGVYEDNTESAAGAISIGGHNNANFTVSNAKIYAATFPDYSGLTAIVDKDFETTEDTDGITFQYPANWAVNDGVLKAVSTGSAGYIQIDGEYDDFVAEFDIRVDSYLTTATNPKLWYNFREGSENANRFYVQNANVCYEQDYGTNGLVALSTGYGKIADTGAFHKMRIAVMGNTYTLEENVDGAWYSVGTFVDNSYNAENGGGAIKFSSGNALFTLDNIKVYGEYTEPEPDYMSWYKVVDKDFETTEDTDGITFQYPNNWAVNDGVLKAVSTGSAGYVQIDGEYNDFVVEFDVRVDSYLTTATNPKLWYNFREGSENANRFYVQNGNICYEQDYGTNGLLVLGTDYGKIADTGVFHKMRVSVKGNTYTIDENVNDKWYSAGTFTDNSYNAENGGGAIRFSAGNALFTLDNIKVYQEEEPQKIITVESEADGLSMVPVDYSVPVTFSDAVTKELLDENLTITASGVAVSDYTTAVSEDGLSAVISFADSLKSASTYEIIVSSTLTGADDAVISFTTSYPVSKQNIEESADNFNLKDATWTVADGVLKAATQGGTWAEIKDLNVADFGLSWTETRTGAAPSTGDNVWYNLKYHNTDGKDNYIQLRVGLNSITTIPWAAGAPQTTANDIGVFSKTPAITVEEPTDFYISANGNNLCAFVRYSADEDYTYLGTIDKFTGDAGTIRLIPSRNVTYDNMTVYLPAEMKAELSGDYAPVKAGEEIVLDFTGEIATVGQTVTITDGTNTYTCTVNEKADKKQLGIVIPQQLEYTTEYTIDLSGVSDIYGKTASAIKVITCAEPAKYEVSKPVYSSGESIQAGKIKITRSITRIEETASTTVVMLSGLYKVEAGQEKMIDITTADVDVTSINSAVEASNELDVPSDGGTYIIRTFVWQNMDTCNPLTGSEELK